MKNNYQCVIIGSGVAGMSAAIYLKRLNIDVLVIEESMPGGQIVKTSIIENYPGFTKIDGATLAMEIHKQVTNLEIPYLYGKVETINITKDSKEVITSQGNITCQSIIIATGRKPRTLNLPNEEQLLGRGISYCAICDGALYKDQEVAIVGGGNSALEEASYLASICSKVTILNRSDKLKADPILINKIKDLKNVEIEYNKEIEQLNIKDGKLKSVTLNDSSTLNITGLFIFIGLIPEVDFIKDIPLKTENGYIIVDKDMQTNIAGIYACGDVIKKDVYQIATAIGEGAIAGVKVSKKIS